MNTSETNQKPTRLTTKQIAYVALRKEGLNQCEAAENAGITRGYSSQLEKKLNKTYDLSNNLLVKKANRTIKKLVDGKPFGSIDKVKDSTSLAAAQMIYDRYQPVVKHNMNVNVNQTFVDVKIGRYQDED